MNKNLQQQIIQIKNIDQKARFACKPGKLSMNNYFVFLVDMANNDLIKNIIKNYGYPTQKLVGKKGVEAFWLLIQHQDKDMKLQKECLEKCDFGSKEKAMLTDRVLLNEGKKQKYGTLLVGEREDIKNVK